ncbi:MAG: hypothetical protein ACRDVE_01320, partial [Actinocrinis sp.]
ATGDVMSGIGHVDPTFSPYAPPESALLGAVNATMLTRAERRDVTRDQWAIGAPFADQLTHTIRIRAARTLTQSTELSRQAEPVRHTRPRPLPGATGILIGKYHRWSLWLAPHRAAGLLAGVAGGPPIAELAYVVADALHAAGQSGSGAEAVDAVGEPDGTYRIELGGVDKATSRMFTEALDELVGPIADPRWFIPRFHLAALPADRRERRAVVRAWLAGRAPHNAVLYHAVPTVFARSAKRLSAFTTCWNDRISPGAPVASASPEGEGVLVTHRGESPLEVTTALRIAWH